MGVGSELRADDVAGLLVARNLARAFPDKANLLVIEGHSAPENFTGEILRFEASHLVIVDCAELGSPPGSVRLFPIDEIGGLSSSTHSLPLSIVIAYLERHHPCETLVIGIQPKNLGFGAKLSQEALRAVDLVSADLAAAISGMGSPGA